MGADCIRGCFLFLSQKNAVHKITVTLHAEQAQEVQALPVLRGTSPYLRNQDQNSLYPKFEKVGNHSLSLLMQLWFWLFPSSL